MARLLLIDDCPDSTLLLSRVLEPFGHELTTAPDGLSGIQLAVANDPDVILLDLLMPGIDGCETCRRLKANDRRKQDPDIFITALSETADK